MAEPLTGGNGFVSPPVQPPNLPLEPGCRDRERQVSAGWVRGSDVVIQQYRHSRACRGPRHFEQVAAGLNRIGSRIQWGQEDVPILSI